MHSPGHPAVRRVIVTLAALLLAAGGIALLVGALDGSGASTTDAPPVSGQPAPAVAGPLGRTLAAGNVVLAYRDAADAGAARAWAREQGGPPTAALVQSGQAVLAARRAQAPRFAALADRRRQAAATLADPALTAFVDAWLGRGAGG